MEDEQFRGEPWREFDARYRQRLVAVMRRRGLQPADADAVANEALERAWRDRDVMSEWTEQQVRGWLFTVANNLATDLQRKERRHANLSPWVPEEIPADEPRLAVNEYKELVGCIAELGARPRQVLELYLAGKRAKTIARIVGISESGVRAIKRRALVRLRQCMAQREKTSRFDAT